MKKRLPLIIILFIAAFGLAATHDYFLLPGSYFLHKGDKLTLHLVEGDQFTKQSEIGFTGGKVRSFTLYSGKKIVNLTNLPKDSTALLIDYPMENIGQSLISVNTGIEHTNSSRDAYADFLNTLGYDKLAEKVKAGNQFRVKERYTRFMKTLFSVDNHDGHEYEKVLGDESEIVLKDNPYNKRYGEDLEAQLLFKGKPAKGQTVTLYIKSLGGNVYSQNYTTDDKGKITITMSREGIFMLRNVHVEPTDDKDADYLSWWTTFTFPFSSTDEVLSTYKEFGFGNIH